MYVPASILSGITLISAPWSSFTPSIFISSVPDPVIFAPMLFRSSAMFTISASRAALLIIVVPLANVAAIMIFIVAPTDAKSKKILAPWSSLASRMYFESSFVIVAPRASKPFKCKSIGLEPILHPPGKYISTCLYLASSEPIK